MGSRHSKLDPQKPVDLQDYQKNPRRSPYFGDGRAGKGSEQRPSSISQEEWGRKYDAIDWSDGDDDGGEEGETEGAPPAEEDGCWFRCTDCGEWTTPGDEGLYCEACGKFFAYPIQPGEF